ncbi:hypothetical protein KR044_002645, partial [Drosophila immigrans]
TTIMAVEYDGGVVIAADSRTTSGTDVVNRMTDKLSRVSDTIYCCRSGSASQSQQLTQLVSDKVYALTFEMGGIVPIQMAASIFANKIYRNRNSNHTSVIVAGWDKESGGQVYYISVSGLMLRQRAAVAGSGAGSIRGYMLANHRKNMPLTDAIKLVKSCTEIAMSYDPYSGGVIRIGVINENGMA